MTVVCNSWYDYPEESLDEQRLMEHAVRESLETHGFGDAFIDIAVTDE